MVGGIVADEEAGRCLDSEGNGVNPGGGDGGGPGSPSGEQDKQLISSRGGGNTHRATKKTGRRVRRDKKDTPYTEYVITVNNYHLYVNSNNIPWQHIQYLTTLLFSFRRINHMAIKLFAFIL